MLLLGKKLSDVDSLEYSEELRSKKNPISDYAVLKQKVESITITNYSKGLYVTLEMFIEVDESFGEVGTFVLENVVIDCDTEMVDDVSSLPCLGPYITIEGYGQLKRQKALPVYQTYGTVAEKSISDIVIGNMNVTYVVAKDEVCAILLNQPANLSNIRVLLLNGKSVYREQVRITCDAPFSATCGDTTVPLEAGTVFDPATVLNGTTDGYVRVDDANAAELFLTDENGKRISYGYDGTFEVRHYEEGYIVINDVPI